MKVGSPFRAAGIALFAMMAAACGRPLSDPSQRVVAYVGDVPLSVADLQLHFKANLVDPGEAGSATAEEIERVKSRLFDQFIEERLLLAEADRVGIEVGEDEIDAYLAPDSAHEPESEERIGYARLAARRRLRIEKLLEAVLQEQPAIEPAEIRRYVETHRAALDPGKRLELRTLRLPTLDDARRVHREIRRRRMTFNEAVVVYEQDPVSGVPVQVGWDALPADVREILDGVKPGQISPPIEMDGNVYVFRVESWLEDPERAESELERRARGLLEHRRWEQARAELIRRARQNAPVRVLTLKLPFAYRAREDPPSRSAEGGDLSG